MDFLLDHLQKEDSRVVFSGDSFAGVGVTREFGGDCVQIPPRIHGIRRPGLRIELISECDSIHVQPAVPCSVRHALARIRIAVWSAGIMFLTVFLHVIVSIS